MRKSCVLRSCKTNNRYLRSSTRAYKVKLHRFPRDAYFREKWREALGLGKNQTLDRFSRVCSRHFNMEDYISGSRLKPSAIPLNNQRSSEVIKELFEQMKIARKKKSVNPQPVNLTKSENKKSQKYVHSGIEFRIGDTIQAVDIFEQRVHGEIEFINKETRVFKVKYDKK